jgi:hypothetical protein
MASEMQRVLGPVGTVFAIASWCVVTLWLGVVGIAEAARCVAGVRRSLTTTLRCPRGHRVELYGTFRCPRCKAVREGRAFDPCPICRARSTHLDCVRCGLAVRDPQS